MLIENTHDFVPVSRIMFCCVDQLTTNMVQVSQMISQCMEQLTERLIFFNIVQATQVFFKILLYQHHSVCIN